MQWKESLWLQKGRKSEAKRTKRNYFPLSEEWRLHPEYEMRSRRLIVFTWKTLCGWKWNVTAISFGSSRRRTAKRLGRPAPGQHYSSHLIASRRAATSRRLIFHARALSIHSAPYFPPHWFLFSWLVSILFYSFEWGAEKGRPNTSWMHNRAEAQQCWGENKQWELMFPKKYSAAVEHYKVDAQGS